MFRFLNKFSTAVALAVFGLTNLEATWMETDVVSSSNYEVTNAMDSSGNATAIWVEWYSKTNHIYSSILPKNGSGWTGVETVYSAEKKLFVSPHVAIDSTGNTVAIWHEFNGKTRKIRAATKPFRGKWSEPVDLSKETESYPSATVAISPLGYGVAIWEVESKIQAASFQFGGSWSFPITIGTGGQPQVCVDALGNAVAVWAGQSHIQSACLPFSGSWSAPENISYAGGYAPKLAMNLSGKVVATWLDRNEKASILEERDSILTASKPLHGHWSAPVMLGRAGMIYDSAVAVDLNGNAVVAWQHSDVLNPTAPYPILSPDTIKASYFFSGQWSNPVVISQPDEQERSMNPMVAFDGAGNAFAVWNTYSAVKSSMLPFHGNWTPPTLVATGFIGLASRPQISVDPTGYAVVNWSTEVGLIKAARWIPDSETAEVQTVADLKRIKF